jgi:pre-mRNA-splicing factor SPF27
MLEQCSCECVPDIDIDVSEKERARIGRILAAELPSDAHSILHPSMPAEPEFNPPPLMRQELERKAAGLPAAGGIDLSRYEAPEGPADEKDVAAWRTTLQRAYASNTYLSGRVSNLSLLEELGKNAWLIGNSQLEDILRQLEKELEELKTATVNVNKSRKAAQEGSRGEMAGLEESWRHGIGRVLEVEVAAEEIRQQILHKRRHQAR